MRKDVAGGDRTISRLFLSRCVPSRPETDRTWYTSPGKLHLGIWLHGHCGCLLFNQICCCWLIHMHWFDGSSAVNCFFEKWVCYWFVTKMAPLCIEQVTNFFKVFWSGSNGAHGGHFKGFASVVSQWCCENVPCSQLKSKLAILVYSLQHTASVSAMSHSVSSSTSYCTSAVSMAWVSPHSLIMCFCPLPPSVCLLICLFSVSCSHSHSYSISMGGNPAICPLHPPSLFAAC